MSVCNGGVDVEISIRAPARGATGLPCTYSACIIFQSALPRGERPGLLSPVAPVQLPFQSALPRGERLSIFRSLRIFFQISIRAPARGATMDALQTLYNTLISIRAPARGATYGFGKDRLTRVISIRAPARGATM